MNNSTTTNTKTGAASNSNSTTFSISNDTHHFSGGSGARCGLVFQLMKLLNDQSVPEALWWLEDEKSFAVNPVKFQVQVLDPFFRGVKFSSFIRTMYKMGFMRQSKRCDLPKGVVGYRHELFEKNRPDLMKTIKSRTKDPCAYNAPSKNGNRKKEVSAVMKGVREARANESMSSRVSSTSSSKSNSPVTLLPAHSTSYLCDQKTVAPAALSAATAKPPTLPSNSSNRGGAASSNNGPARAFLAASHRGLASRRVQNELSLRNSSLMNPRQLVGLGGTVQNLPSSITKVDLRRSVPASLTTAANNGLVRQPQGALATTSGNRVPASTNSLLGVAALAQKQRQIAEIQMQLLHNQQIQNDRMRLKLALLRQQATLSGASSAVAPRDPPADRP